MPPVLHVALDELPARCTQEVFARQVGPRDRESHHVLELIPKPERAARLVISSPGPEAGADILIEQPAIHQHVE
jgi:hypothetical protein